MKGPLASVLIILTIGSGVIGAQANSERDKIEFLISSVAALQGAKFIRNGSEYDARAAADHLRLKLRMAGGRVRTAEDFIRLCATKSSTSGAPYLIRFPDGTTITAEAYFRKKLSEFPPTTN